jgi:hypothetical protein
MEQESTQQSKEFGWLYFPDDRELIQRVFSLSESARTEVEFANLPFRGDDRTLQTA